MRNAWKVRVAACRPAIFCRAQHPLRRVSASSAVRVNGSFARRATMARAMRARAALVAQVKQDVGELGLLWPVDDIGGGRSAARHAHVERPVATGRRSRARDRRAAWRRRRCRARRRRRARSRPSVANSVELAECALDQRGVRRWRSATLCGRDQAVGSRSMASTRAPAPLQDRSV